MGGTWAKGPGKLKHVRTADGYELSRARMRRDKRRWREEYGELPQAVRSRELSLSLLLAPSFLFPSISGFAKRWREGDGRGVCTHAGWDEGA